jgi:hypothetical protein
VKLGVIKSINMNNFLFPTAKLQDEWKFMTKI